MQNSDLKLTQNALIGAIAVSFSFGAAVIWMAFCHDFVISFGDDSGDRASWVAAIAGCASAVGTFYIGVKAASFAKASEKATREEELRRSRADMEITCARLMIVKNKADGARRPKQVLDFVAKRIADLRAGKPTSAGEIPNEVMLSRKGISIRINNTLRSLESIVWSDEFKCGLHEEAIAAVHQLELALIKYKSTAEMHVFDLSEPQRYFYKAVNLADGTEAWEDTYQVEDDGGIKVLQTLAGELSVGATNAIALIDKRLEDLHSKQCAREKQILSTG